MNGRIPIATLATLLLVAIACDSARTREASGELRVLPASIAFGDVVVGVTSEQVVRVENAGRSDLIVASEVAEPFACSPELHLPAGASVDLELRFAPTVEESYSRTLRLRAGDDVVDVALTGRGAGVPQCSSSDACSTSQFSFESGACISLPVADGTPCSDACLAGAACTNGVCRGEPTSCDDGDPCTIDACASTTGCVHAPMDCAVDGPADPCRASWCDPQLGCVTAVKPDGASCDDHRVCEAGACVWPRQSAADRCSSPTPCQPAGSWNGGECERPAAATLQPAWTYQPIGTWHFDAPARDVQDNLYFFERELNGTSASAQNLVSLDPNGNLRFRLPTDTRRFPDLIASHGALFSFESKSGPPYLDELVARSLVDGGELWREDLRDDVGLAKGMHHDLHGAPGGRLVLTVSEEWNSLPVHLVSFDLATRTVLWTETFPPATSIGSVDDSGNIELFRSHERHFRSAEGVKLWSEPYLNYGAELAHLGLLFRHDGRLARVEDGATVFDLSVDGRQIGHSPNPRFLMPGLAVMLGAPRPPNETWGYYSLPPTHVFTQPLSGGLASITQPDDKLPLVTASQLSLTRAGGLIYAADDRAGGFLLREVRVTGEVLYECPLPYLSPPCCPGFSLHQYSDFQLLLAGRWITMGRTNDSSLIYAFDVPGAYPVTGGRGPGWSNYVP